MKQVDYWDCDDSGEAVRVGNILLALDCQLITLTAMTRWRIWYTVPSIRAVETRMEVEKRLKVMDDLNQESIATDSR